MHRKGTAPPIHMYGLTLQKTNRINQAVHGNFAGTKQQLIVVGRGKILELLKPDSSTGTMSSLCGLFQLPVSLKKKAEGKFLCALSLCVCVHACAVCTNVRVCTIVRVCVCVCVSLSPSLSLSLPFFLSFSAPAPTQTHAHCHAFRLHPNTITTVKEVYGIIRSIRPFRLTGSNKDYIVVGTDSGR